MGAGDLAGSLTLNSTGWDSTLARADAKASAFADKVEHKLSKKVSKLFGAGFVAGAIITPIHKIVDAFTDAPVERAKKLKEESEKLHITAEEYQMIEAAAKAAGLSVDEWITSVQNGSKPLTQVISQLEKFRSEVKLTSEDVENLAGQDIWKDVSKWWTPKLASGLKFIQDASALWMAKFSGMSLDDAAAGIKADDIAQAKNAKADSAGGLLKALTKKNSGAFRGEFGVNELQRMGAFVGGSGGTAEKSLQEIADNTKRTADAIDKRSSETPATYAPPPGAMMGPSGMGGIWDWR